MYGIMSIPMYGIYTHNIDRCHIDSYIKYINMQIEVRDSLWKYELHY